MPREMIRVVDRYRACSRRSVSIRPMKRGIHRGVVDTGDCRRVMRTAFHRRSAARAARAHDGDAGKWRTLERLEPGSGETELAGGRRGSLRAAHAKNETQGSYEARYDCYSVRSHPDTLRFVLMK